MVQYHLSFAWTACLDMVMQEESGGPISSHTGQYLCHYLHKIHSSMHSN